MKLSTAWSLYADLLDHRAKELKRSADSPAKKAAVRALTAASEEADCVARRCAEDEGNQD